MKKIITESGVSETIYKIDPVVVYINDRAVWLNIDLAVNSNECSIGGLDPSKWFYEMLYAHVIVAVDDQKESEGKIMIVEKLEIDYIFTTFFQILKKLGVNVKSLSYEVSTN